MLLDDSAIGVVLENHTFRRNSSTIAVCSSILEELLLAETATTCGRIVIHHSDVDTFEGNLKRLSVSRIVEKCFLFARGKSSRCCLVPGVEAKVSYPALRIRELCHLTFFVVLIEERRSSWRVVIERVGNFRKLDLRQLPLRIIT